MADVPFATNLLGAIAPYIATAPGAMLPGQAIGNLPDAYWAGQNQANIQAQRDIFKNGIPPNAGAMIDALARVQGAGAAPSIMQYYKMLYGPAVDRVISGSDTGAPAEMPASRVAPPSIEGGATPNAVGVQPPSAGNVPANWTGGLVPSSPTVVGDKEGVERGYYNAPTVQGARPPIQQDAAAAMSPAQRVAQAFDPNTAQELALPAGADPTLGGLVPRGRTPQQQIGLMSDALSRGMLEPELAKKYEQNIQAIYQALQQYREGAIRNAELPQEVKTSRAAGFSNPLEYEQAKARQAATVAQEAEQDKTIRKNYETSQTGLYRLGLIDESIKSLGPQWMGTGANFRTNMAKAYNSFRDMLPDAVRRETPQFDPKKIASWEDFNKQTLNLGFETARSLGTREAMQIVNQATKSVPGVEQSFWGARLVSSSVRQALQRTADYREFVRALPPGQRLDADVAFNRLHPPSEYVTKAVSVVPPEPAIQFLRKNPDTRKEFDRKFGNGASIGVFGPQ